jgi:hypothetical protein
MTNGGYAHTMKYHIDTEAFVYRMEKHWIQELANVSSKALRDSWAQLAGTFNRHIYGHMESTRRKRWDVLCPPTGAGKTEGAITYCAMLAEAAMKDDGAGDFLHPGALIVTRRIADCDIIAERINRFTGAGEGSTAVAFHSDNKVKLENLRDFQTVVITHRAYELALDKLGAGARIQDTWSFFHDFGFADTRKLVIIDEALDIVEHSTSTLDGLRQAMGFVPQYVRVDYPQEVQVLEDTIGMLGRLAMRGKDKDEKVSISEYISTEQIKQILPAGEVPDLFGLIQGVKEVELFRFGGNNAKVQRANRNQCISTLKSMHYIFRSWSFFKKNTADVSLNSARLLVPEGVKGAVVLDATAMKNVVYDVHEDSVVHPTVPGVRSYRNVTLHVTEGNRTGKVYMTKEAKKVGEALMGALNPILAGRNVFLACHKGAEPVFNSFETTFKMTTGHWGEIDGSNEWRDCDAAIICGLPFMTDTWTANVFMALQGVQDDEWLQDPSRRAFKDYPDIRQALNWGQITTSVIQAINRIQCRKVVDQWGNCRATDVYLVTGRGKASEKLVEDIQEAMPGLGVVYDWDLGTAAKKKARRSKFDEALRVAMRNQMLPKKATKADISRALKTTVRTVDRLLQKLRDTSSPLHQAMVEFGYRLETGGAGGRGRSTLLVRGT